MKDLFAEMKQVYLIHTGRIDRSTWWIYSVPLFLISHGCWFLVLKYGPTLLLGCLLLSLTVFISVISIKRLHDTNISGSALLLVVIPLLGLLFLLIVCGFIKGTDGENKYGEQPEE